MRIEGGAAPVSGGASGLGQATAEALDARRPKVEVIRLDGALRMAPR